MPRLSVKESHSFAKQREIGFEVGDQEKPEQIDSWISAIFFQH
jgi:hypothetical protein